MTSFPHMTELITWSAALPLWQRDALRRLYATCPLGADDEEELFSAFEKEYQLADANGSSPELDPLTSDSFPAIPSSSPAVTLSSLGSTKNVNALKEKQKLSFGENGLTVIFGSNGSGKSGYARVLKALCRARADEPILHNVYESGSKGKASADIEFALGGVPQARFTWTTGGAVPSHLSRISFFDSKCAAVHVDEKNEAAYIPLPLLVLRELSALCRAFKTRLQERTAALSKQQSPHLANLTCSPSTRVGFYLNALSAESSLDEAKTLAALSPTETQRLEELTRQLEADPERLLSLEEDKARRLTAICERVVRIEQQLADAAAVEYQSAVRNASNANAAATLAATAAFDNEPLPGVGSATWKALWEAARAYSTTEAYPDDRFPKTDDALCVLCQQPLQTETSERLTRFEAFVKAEAQRRAATAAQALSERRTALSTSPSAEQRVTDTAYLREDLGSDELAGELELFWSTSDLRRSTLLEVSAESDLGSLQPLPQTASRSLRDAIEASSLRVKELKRQVDPSARKVVEAEHRELLDRRYLQGLVVAVEQDIARRVRLGRLAAAIADTDTGTITRKSSLLADELITSACRDRFANEVSRLGLHHLRIELQRETGSYGSARFRVVLIASNAAKLGAILSEGEHRCIALAAFLTELATASDTSALIFDDPVSSLDHDYREFVAKRLSQEGATGRQVIVFTHDVFLLSMLSDCCERANVPISCLTVNRLPDGTRCGVVEKGLPPNVAPASVMADGIRCQVKQFRKLYDNGLIGEWNRHTNGLSNQLRQCWERAVSEIVAPVIRRFESRIETKNVWQLTAIDVADCLAMRQAFHRCSELAHERCAEVERADPTPDEFLAEVKALEGWLSGIRAKQETAQQTHPH